MKRLSGAPAASVLIPVIIMCAAGPALAQAANETTVTIPYGDWIGQASGVIASTAALIIAWALRQLPAQYVGLAKAARLDQVLLRAIDYAINVTAGASKDKVLTLDLGNVVLAQAVSYVIKHAPGWLVQWAGGAQGIREKIIARLELEPAAALT